MSGFKSVFLLCFCLFTAISAYSQRGKIITQASASGRAVMDPNLDGYISYPANSPPGFSSNGLYFVDEFEIPMFGIPKLGGDVAGDNIGRRCGITDLIPDSLGYSVYAVRDANDNLIFRFRVGDDNSSVEAWSILLDTDNKFGTADPNYTPDNPGFEIDITLIKNSNNKGIYVYNIDGTDNCPSELLFYPIQDYFQISIADEVTCGDEDFFYDFYVPFAAMAAAFNNDNCLSCDDIDENTGLRYAALTNVSATCAMGGNIADISGVDNNDPEYDGCNECAFVDLVENQCPTPIVDLDEGGSGFEKEKVTRPSIFQPIRAGQDSVAGTTVEANIYVKLFVFGNIGTAANPSWGTTPRESHEGYAIGNSWYFYLNDPLQPYDSIVAKTQLTQNSVPCGGAGNNTSSTSVTIVEPNDKPVAVEQFLTLAEDTQLSFNLIGSDPDNDPISFNIIPFQGPYHGSLSGSGTSWVYTPFANYNGLDSLFFKVSDGIYDSINLVNFTVTPVNDAPVVTGSGGSVSYTVIQSNIAIDNNISVTDIDDDNIENATISLSANFTTGQDILLFNNTGTITGTYSASTGILTLTGTATKAAYAAALSTIQYRNNSNQPNTATRTVSYVVNDGNVNSAGYARNIVINIGNYPPVITDTNGQLNYSTPEDTPLTNQCITVTDPENQSVSISQATSLTNHGTTTITGLCFNFTPALNYNGEERIRMVVCDNGLPSACDTVLVVITITPVNDPPVAVNDAATTQEDTPVTFNILSNDSDIENALNPTSVILSSTNVADQGSFVYNGGGSVTFTPFSNFVGNVSITYTVADLGGAVSNSAAISVTVSSVNDVPIAQDDSFTAPEDTQLNANVLLNDSDIDQDVLTLTQFTVPGDLTIYNAGNPATVAGIGSITLNSNGGLVFTPASNYNNATPDLVATYMVSDGKGGTDQATVSIQITPVNDNPVGNNDTGASNNVFTTPENTPITLASNANILDNDTDPDGDALVVTQFSVNANTYTIIAGNSNTASLSGVGTVIIHSNGDLEFSPVTNYNGTVPVITYTVSDGNGGTASATVTIIVTPVNSQPIAQNDSFLTLEDAVLNTGNVLTNDSDPENDALVVTQFVVSGSGTVTAGSTGTITGIGTLKLNGNGTFTFTPALNYTNSSPVVVATYTISDGNGGTASATISIRVTPINDSPVGGNDTGADAFVTLEDTPITLADDANVLDNDVDPDGDPLTVTRFAVNATNYDITAGNSATATLSGIGTVTIYSNGDVEYTPVLNFNGNVPLITYTVSDGTGTTTATARITVTPVNDAPIANNDEFSTLQNTALNANVLSNDSDIDGHTLSVSQFTIVGDGTTYTAGNNANIAGVGLLTIASNGNLTFTPEPTYTGTVPIITYTATDGNGGSDNANVTIDVVLVINYPIAANDVYSTPEEVTLNGVNILTNDQADIGNTLSITQFTIAGDATIYNAGQTAVIGDSGSLLIASDGSLEFVPTTNFNGTLPIITYTAYDGSESASASVNITVTPVDDLPVALDDDYTISEEAVLNDNVLSNDIDVDDDGLTVTEFTVTGGGSISPGSTGTITNVGTLKVNADGSLVFIPAANYNNTGPVTIATYTVTDGITTDQATISITVNPVNDLPVGGNETNADAFTTQEDDPIQLSDNANVLDNDTDPEGDILSVTQFVWNSVTHSVAAGGSISATITSTGTVTLHSDGRLEFSPAQNFNGNVPLITYTITDPEGATATAVARIVVTAVNDAPIAANDSYQTAEDATLNGIVLTNDSDVDGDNLTVTQFAVTGGGIFAAGNAGTIPGIGSLTINANGSFIFTPALNYFNASAVIVANYTITDGNIIDDATIEIRVTPVNDNPNGVSETGTDSFVTQEDDPIELSEGANVLSNDTDPENEILSVTQFVVNGITYTITPGSTATPTLTGVGVITLHSNGALEFTPALNFNGNVPLITYAVSDGTNTSNASAQIIVNGVNDAPLAVKDENFSTTEDNTLNENVLTNDSDPDGDLLSVTRFIVTGSAVQVSAGNPAIVSGIGTLTINANGSLVFTPQLNYNNVTPVITATYTVTDGLATSTATVSIRVTPVNDPPVGNNDAGSSNDKFTTIEDTQITLAAGANVLVNDTDVDGDQLIVTQFVVGTTTYPITTGGNASATIVGSGVITLHATGELNFTPEPNFNGIISGISYSITDGNGGSASASIEIVVTPENDAPIATITDNLTQEEDQALPFCINVQDLELNNISVDNLTGIIKNSTEAGSTLVITSINNTQVCLLFTPGNNFHGESEWTITICDDGTPSKCTSVNAVIEITPVNDAPVIVNDVATTQEDVNSIINVLANDSDPDTAIDPNNRINPITIDLNPSTPTEDKTMEIAGKGTFTADNSGIVTFDPFQDYAGTPVLINYTVKDFGGLASNLGLITITIIPVNDPPLITEIPATLDSIWEDQTLRVSRYAYDPDGDAVTWQIINLHGGGTMPPDPDPNFADFSYQFNPEPNYNGESRWQLRACDSNNACSTVEFTIPIKPVNDAPVAADDNADAPAGTTVTIPVLDNDLVIEAPFDEFYDVYLALDSVDNLEITRVETIDGTAVIVNNTIQYTPDLTYVGKQATIKYWIRDSGGLIDSAFVYINVGPARFHIFEGLSPNGDGNNDFWRINGIEQDPNNLVRVFDRFNNLIFETKGYTNESNYWVGQSTHGVSRANVPDGTYYYTINIDLQEDNEGERVFKGYVVLKRN
jgi:gliding motility-associated-like protein